MADGSLRERLWRAVAAPWTTGLADEIPALSWFLVTSLVPLALGLTALATLLLGDADQAERLSRRIANVLPADAHAEISEVILRTKHDSPLLLVAAVIGMLWTGSGAVGVLARALTRLLEIPEHGIVLGKLRNIGVAGALALLIVLMVLAGSAGTGVVRQLGLPPTLTRVVVPIVAITCTVLLCAGTYWTLATGAVSRRAALTGGAVAAVILQLTPIVAGYYLRYAASRTPVGVFLVLTGILFTCYVAAAGLLLGAGVMAGVELRLAADT